MTDEMNTPETVTVTVTEAPAPRRGRPPKAAAAEPVEPVNTIINLETPQIVITRADEPAEEVEAPISEQTRREMEAGRKIVDAYR